MKSLSYYLTLLVIKIKGAKKEFKKDPIDFQKLREQDIHSPDPEKFSPLIFKQFSVGNTTISEINPVGSGKSLILFCHGGAFVYGPVDYHWSAACNLALRTDNVVWLIDYPKAPEHNIVEISGEIDGVFKKALEHFPVKNVILAGDSVGGTLLTALVQRQINLSKAVPGLLVLISPVMDASFSNPIIPEIDNIDPILSKNGALSAKKMATGGIYLKDPLISPLYGSFKNFPPTILFLAENDISKPDAELALKKIREHDVDVEVISGDGMPHIWPLLPVMKEAKMAFSIVVEKIKSYSSYN